MSVKIEIKRLEELKAAFKKFPMVVGQEIQKAIASSVMLVNRNAKMEAPVKTGTLRRGIKSKISPFQGKVESTIGYGIFVHEGTAAHIIKPVRKQALYWKGAAHPVKSVRHPGIKADPFMKRGAERSEGQVQAIFQKAINNVTTKLAI